jgi:CheY-like chemotaxis protein
MTAILLIDDEPEILSNMAQLLEYENYDVIVCLNGADALETLELRPIDLILCDMQMWPMNGFEVLKAVQQDNKLSHIPFVFVTAVLWNEQETPIFGVVDFVIKPFTVDQLLAVVRENVGNAS